MQDCKNAKTPNNISKYLCRYLPQAKYFLLSVTSLNGVNKKIVKFMEVAWGWRGCDRVEDDEVWNWR